MKKDTREEKPEEKGAENPSAPSPTTGATPQTTGPKDYSGCCRPRIEDDHTTVHYGRVDPDGYRHVSRWFD